LGTKASPSLTDSVLKLTGVGPRVEEKLNRIGILTVQDLLFHLPLRYQDKTQLSLIGTLQPGQEALIEGTIEITQIKFGRRRSLLCMISDGSGTLILRFFHFSKAQQQRLGKGTILRCYGQIRRGAKTLEITHPEYRHIDPDNSPAIEKQLTAIYPLTEGLQQRTLQNEKVLKEDPVNSALASVSVGIYKGTAILDLDYAEDSNAETDMNVVMNGDGQFIEVQGTAEGHAFSSEELNNMLSLAQKGINELFEHQKKALAG